MKKILSAILLLLAAILAIFSLSKQPTDKPAIMPTITPVKKTVEIDIVGKAKITADLAQTPEEKAQGLSGRENLNDNQGMLFIFSNYSQPGFWMKEMLISIDIIWIRDEKIVDITENLPPPAPGTSLSDLQTYQPKESINYVLEVPAGFVARHSVVEGDIINYQF